MYLVVASVVAPLHLGPADSIDHLFHRALLPLGCNGSILQPSSGVIGPLPAHPLSGSPCENSLPDLNTQKRDVDLRQRPNSQHAFVLLVCFRREAYARATRVQSRTVHWPPLKHRALGTKNALCQAQRAEHKWHVVRGLLSWAGHTGPIDIGVVIRPQLYRRDPLKLSGRGHISAVRKSSHCFS